MIEPPGVMRRRQGIEAGDLISDQYHEGRSRDDGLGRDGELLLPRFDRVGRVAPIRFRLERKGGKSFGFVALRWTDVHLSGRAGSARSDAVLLRSAACAT